MIDAQARDDDYCAAIERIKQILAKYRPDVTHLHGNAVLSPRILMLLIERSETHIPAGIFARLRPQAESVLNESELSHAELVGVAVQDDVRSRIQTDVASAYEAIAKLHAEVMKCP